MTVFTVVICYCAIMIVVNFDNHPALVLVILFATQVIEKAWKHLSDLFVLFVGLNFVYNSMPCPALLRVLAIVKLGVPLAVISIFS